MVPFGNRRASFATLKPSVLSLGRTNPAEVVLPPVTGSPRYYVCKLCLTDAVAQSSVQNLVSHTGWPIGGGEHVLQRAYLKVRRIE